MIAKNIKYFSKLFMEFFLDLHPDIENETGALPLKLK